MYNPNPDSRQTTRRLHPQEDPNSTPNPQVPLRNLSLVRTRIDSLRTFLSQSINTNTPLTTDHITLVSNQIVSAIHNTIVNAAALVSYSQNLTVPGPSVFPPLKLKPEPSAVDKTNHQKSDSRIEPAEDDDDYLVDDDCEIVELDAVELLAEHIHFCEICGKGFKRDANLRMHMRAHGNKFKTPEALAKPIDDGGRRRATRFSCPFQGCNRNKMHMKFRALKSVVCVKNHFKRSHCPKMYSCNRCHKKNYSVLSDLKSHMKQCGECRWKCSCGTTFSRKDKLFGHVALFEGHMPDFLFEDEEKEKGKQVMVEESEEDPMALTFTQVDLGMDEEFFDDFGSIDNYCLREVLGFPNTN